MRSPSLTFTGSGGPRELCSRLHSRYERWYLGRLLKSLRKQLDRKEAAMAVLKEEADALHARWKVSPTLAARREVLREEHETLATRWLTTRKELDALEALS